MKNIEIERKFLVKGDFVPFAVKKFDIVQGYLCTTADKTVRVRTKGDDAFITIKGASNKNGFSHSEFEYSIPFSDAQDILKLCDNLIEKERFIVPFELHNYEVDVFHGVHEGLIIAELELESEEEAFEKPEWLGEEVTGDVRYYNAYLATHTIE